MNVVWTVWSGKLIKIWKSYASTTVQHDGTVEKNRSTHDPRIKLIVRGQNYGISLTRIFGIGIASGKYIGFIDSDDFVDPDFIKKLHRSMIENDAEIVSTATRVIWPDKAEFGRQNRKSAKIRRSNSLPFATAAAGTNFTERDLIRRNNIEFPAGVVFRR